MEPPLSPLLQKTSLNVRAHLTDQQRLPLYIIAIFLYIWAITDQKKYDTLNIASAAPMIQHVMCLQKWPKEKQKFLLLWNLIFLKPGGRKNKMEKCSTLLWVQLLQMPQMIVFTKVVVTLWGDVPVFDDYKSCMMSVWWYSTCDKVSVQRFSVFLTEGTDLKSVKHLIIFTTKLSFIISNMVKNK